MESFFRMIRYKTFYYLLNLILFSILQKILKNKTSPYVSTYINTMRLLVHWLYIPALLQGSIPIVHLENLVLKINEQQVSSKSNIMKEQDLLLCDSHHLQIKISFYFHLHALLCVCPFCCFLEYHGHSVYLTLSSLRISILSLFIMLVMSAMF